MDKSEENNKKKNNSKTIWIVITALVVVAIVGSIIATTMNNSDNDTNETNNDTNNQTTDDADNEDESVAPNETGLGLTLDIENTEVTVFIDDSVKFQKIEYVIIDENKDGIDGCSQLELSDDEWTTVDNQSIKYTSEDVEDEHDICVRALPEDDENKEYVFAYTSLHDTAHETIESDSSDDDDDLPPSNESNGGQTDDNNDSSGSEINRNNSDNSSEELGLDSHYIDWEDEDGQAIFDKYSDNAAVNRWLFFHADWCPKCRAIEKSINDNLDDIPNNLIIFKVDYDKATDLKKKYDVRVQSSILAIDENDKEVGRYQGDTSSELDDLIEELLTVIVPTSYESSL